MKPAVLCARPSALWSHAVSSAGLRLLEGPAGDDAWSWTEHPEEVHGLFCSSLPENLEAFTALRWVQIDSAGFSQIIPANLPARGVTATNAAGVFDIPIAEWCVAMMVNLARDAGGLFRNQQGAVWDRDPRFQREIRGATVGFWGYGGLARETARLSKALGLTVHVLARGELRRREETFVVEGTGDPLALLPDRVFSPAETFDFLAGLDFLVMALPLTPATQGICAEAHLRALPKRACLLNPARGPLIEEAALIRALREGWFAGAALDTHYQYPLPPEHPLWCLPNVLLTPHISGSTGSPGYVTRVGEIFTQNLHRFAKDQPLLNQIPPADLRPS